VKLLESIPQISAAAEAGRFTSRYNAQETAQYGTG